MALMALFLVDPTTAKARQEAHAENGTCKSSGACISSDASMTAIDSTIQAEYQYIENTQADKHMDALIRFLVEQHRKCKGDQQ